MFRKRSSPSRSIRGFVTALLGASILLVLLLYGLALTLGRLKPVVDYVSPIVHFLGTGPGVLLSATVAILLILWAAPIRQPKSKANPATTSSSRLDRERQRLRAELQESKLQRERMRLTLQEGEQEREQLKAKLREAEQERERSKAQLRAGDQEREQLKAKLREAEQAFELLRTNLQEDLQENLQEQEREREWLKSEIERLRSERQTLEGKLTTYDRRVALKQALDTAYWDGLHLRRRTPSHRRGIGRRRRSNDEAAAKWAIRTNELITEALGEGQARRFLGVNSHRSGESSATERQEELDQRLKWLAELIQRVDSFEPLELEAGFRNQERFGSQ